MSKLDWDKAKRRPRAEAAAGRKTETVKVHPNSTAARKWGRSTWERRG